MDNEYGLGTVNIKESELPAGAKSHDVGKRMTVTMEVEKTGINKRRDYSSDSGLPTVAKGPNAKAPKSKYVMEHTFKIVGLKPDKQPL